MSRVVSSCVTCGIEQIQTTMFRTMLTTLVTLSFLIVATSAGNVRDAAEEFPKPDNAPGGASSGFGGGLASANSPDSDTSGGDAAGGAIGRIYRKSVVEEAGGIPDAATAPGGAPSAIPDPGQGGAGDAVGLSGGRSFKAEAPGGIPDAANAPGGAPSGFDGGLASANVPDSDTSGGDAAGGAIGRLHRGVVGAAGGIPYAGNAPGGDTAGFPQAGDASGSAGGAVRVPVGGFSGLPSSPAGPARAGDASGLRRVDGANAGASAGSAGRQLPVPIPGAENIPAGLPPVGVPDQTFPGSPGGFPGLPSSITNGSEGRLHHWNQFVCYFLCFLLVLFSF